MFFRLGLNNEKSIHHPPSSISLSPISPSVILPSRNPPSRLLGQFDYYNIKNSSAFRNYDRNMTGRQDDRQDDRQRILDEYMIDLTLNLILLLLVKCGLIIFLKYRRQSFNVVFALSHVFSNLSLYWCFFLLFFYQNS